MPTIIVIGGANTLSKKWENSFIFGLKVLYSLYGNDITYSNFSDYTGSNR